MSVKAAPTVSINNFSEAASIEKLEDGHIFLVTRSKVSVGKLDSLEFDIDVGDAVRYKVKNNIITPPLEDTYKGSPWFTMTVTPPAEGSSCYKVQQQYNSSIAECTYFFCYAGTLHFTVVDTSNDTEEKYTIIIDNYNSGTFNSPSSSDESHISSIELYNGENDMVLSEKDGSEAVISYGLNDAYGSSHIRKVSITGENPSVKLKLQQRGADKNAIRARKALRLPYISWGQNYISVNGGEPFRADASDDKSEYLSRRIPLKKGTNVIQIWVKDEIIDYWPDSGLGLAGMYGGSASSPGHFHGYTYIIEANGDGKPNTASADASIKGAEASSAAYNDNVKSDGTIRTPNLNREAAQLESYTVGLEKGTEEEPHKLILPKTFLDPDRKKSSDVILGLKLSDTEANWRLKESALQNGEKFGNCACIRAKEIIDDHNSTFAVEVIDGSGAVLGTHYFKIELANSDCSLESLSAQADGKNCPVSISENSCLYHVEKGTAGSAILMAKPVEGAKLEVDGVSCENGEAVITDFLHPTRLTVTAQDTVTKKDYYIIYEENGKSLYFSVSDDTKREADALLAAWKKRKNLSGTAKRELGGYWGVFMNAATKEKADDKPFDNVLVTDIFRITKENSQQATTYAAAILELVILGENPYDYGGVNYVEKLQSYRQAPGVYGAYANNIWTLIAYRAAGVEPETELIQSVKNQAMSPIFNVDMRAWALAATYDYMTEWEVFQAVENLRKAQVANTEKRAGHTPDEKEIGMFMEDGYNSVNMMTHGCALAGLANAGVDVASQFPVTLPDGTVTDPLKVMKNFQDENGFKYSLSLPRNYIDKDTTIGLGSVAYGNGKTVFSQYALTEQKFLDLINAGETLKDKEGIDEKKKTALEKALQAKPNTKTLEHNGKFVANGEAYWNLYKAIGDIDPAVLEALGKPKNIRFCTKEQSDQVDSINETIETLKKVESKDRAGYIQYAKAISDAKKTYEALGTDDPDYKVTVSGNETTVEIGNKGLIPRLQSYVKDYDVLEAAYEAIEGDLSAIEAVITAIDDLAEPATLAKKAEVEAAYAKYEALSAEQKTAITNLDKLEGLRRDIANIEAAIAAIKALPSQVTLSDQAKVDAAQKAYDALTDELKKEVTNAADLRNAQARLADLKAADAVTQQIAAIGTITEANWRVQEPVVAAAKDSYNRLTAAQKALVTNLSVLTAAENAIASFKTETADKEAADVIIDQIAKIGEITQENWSQKETQLAAIRAAYDRLTASQKNLVTNLSALETAENTVKEYKANAAADNGVPQIIELIQALRGTAAVSGNQAQDGPLALTEKNNNTPTWEIWTDEWRQYVADIRSRIRQLEPGLESTVTNLADLEAAEKYISQLKVGKVTDMIAALPNADTIANYQEAAEGKTELTAEQLTAILEAKAAYDNLTPEQKQAVDAATAANLEALYAKAQTYPDSRTLYLQAYLQPYVDSLAYYYQRYQQEGLERSGLASVREALGKCDEFTEEEQAVLQDMSGQVNGEAVPFGELFSSLDKQAGQVQKDINDALEADARIAALPDEITEENVNEVDNEIAAIEQMLEEMTWSAKSYMKNQGRLGVLKALVDYYLSGDEVRQAFEAGSVQLVSAEALTANSVQVSWMSYDGAGSYLVLRKTAKGNWKQIAEVTELAYTDDSAKQGTTYVYTVQARSKRWDGEALSGYNTEGLSVTTPVEKLTRPSWKSVQSAGYQSVKLSWHKVSGASGYEVSRAASKNGKYRKIAAVTKTSCTDKGLTTGKTYYYKVRAYRTGKKKTYGAYSAPIAGTPRLAKVTLSQTKGVKRAVQLKWKKVNGATGYKVYRAASKNDTFKAIKTLKKVTSFKDTGVTPKKTYYYRVCAYRTVKGKTTTGSRSNIGKAAAK